MLGQLRSQIVREWLDLPDAVGGLVGLDVSKDEHPPWKSFFGLFREACSGVFGGSPSTTRENRRDEDSDESSRSYGPTGAE